MKKIKNLMTRMSGEIKEVGKKFPLTMLLIAFVTILYTIAIDQDFSRAIDEMLEKIYLFCTIWGIGAFFTENRFVSKKSKIISYGITGVISLIFTEIDTFFDLTESQEMMVLRTLASYACILVLLSIYNAMKNAELKFEEYFLKFFRDVFNTTATYIILNIGIVIITSIFVQLILDGHYGSVLERLLTLLFGLFYVPSMVYAFSGISSKEVNSFIKGLVLYVLLPLTTIAIGIIYLYIAKIIILRDMPQNTIYRILAGIFVAGFPVWNMASNYAQEKKFIGKIVKVLPYLYAPFILLEIYSIGTRIGEFGVTPMRYISCMFIVFQVICLALTFYKKKEKISSIFIYTSVLVLIVLLSPWNYENVSNWSQKQIIEKRMSENTDFEQLSEEDKTYVKSAYRYLKSEVNGEKYIPDYLTEEEKNKINEYYNQNREKYEYPEYVSVDCELNLDIEQYKKIRIVKGRNTDSDRAIVKLEEEKDIDLSKQVEELFQKNQEHKIDLEEYFKEKNIVKISDWEDFYISRISFSYYKTSKKFNYLNVEGYILER